MNYYSNDETSWVPLIACVVALFLVIFGTNACSAGDWNNGECPNCEVRYELRGASRGLKYYACPDCGKEVERY